MKSMKPEHKRTLFEVAVVFFWASEYCHTPYFTPYLASLGLDATIIGLIVGCYGFTQMLVRIPLGIATDASSAYKTVTTGGLFFTTLSSFGLWLFTDVRLIFLFRVFAGIAASSWIAMTVAYMSYFREEDAVNATAILNSLNNGGKLLAFVLGAAAAHFWGYRSALLASFLTGLVGLCIMPFTSKVEIRRNPASLRSFLECLRNRNTLTAALLAAVAMMIVHGTVFSFTSTLAEQLGASALMLSVLSIVYTLVQILSLGFIRSERIKNGPRNLEITAGFVLMSVYLVVLAFARNAASILAGQIIAGFGFALLNSLLMSECVRGIPAGEKSTAMGIFQAVYGIGMTVGPVYMGRIIDSLGAKTGCLILAAFVLVIAAIAARFCFRVPHRA